MWYLQKAYALVSNGVNKKDHLLKAHLDIATQELLSNQLDTEKSGLEGQFGKEMGAIIPINHNLFPDDATQSYDIVAQHNIMKDIRSQYGIHRPSSKAKDKVVKIRSNEEPTNIPLNQASSTFVENRKLEAEENCLNTIVAYNDDDKSDRVFSTVGETRSRSSNSKHKNET